MVPLYTRFLEPGEFGSIDLVTSTAALILPLISLTVFEAVLRFTMTRTESSAAVVSNALALGAASCSIFLLTYPVAAQLRLLEGILPFAYAIVVVQVFFSISSQYARGTGQIKIFAIASLLQAGLFAAGNIVTLVILDLGVVGYLSCVVVSTLVATRFSSTTTGMWREIRLQNVDLRLLRMMLRYCIPLAPNYAMWWLVNSSNRYFILAHAGASSLGVYAVANRVPMMLIALTALLRRRGKSPHSKVTRTLIATPITRARFVRTR